MSRFLFTCPRCAESVSPRESACPACGYSRLTMNGRTMSGKRAAGARVEPAKKKNGRGPGERKQLLRSEARAEYGITTTWEAPGTALHPLTIHRQGKARVALRESASIALGESESYRLVAYSTPETIYTDLIGARGDALHPPRGFKATYSKPMPKALPEVLALGAAGLPRALLHPRLERPTARRRLARYAACDASSRRQEPTHRSSPRGDRSPSGQELEQPHATPRPRGHQAPLEPAMPSRRQEPV